MLKNILKLDGAQEIKKNEQKTINGGFGSQSGCSTDLDCELTGLYCHGRVSCLPFNGGVCLGQIFSSNC